MTGTTITFRPDANYSGDATFTYTLSDVDGASDAAIVTVNVNQVADMPFFLPSDMEEHYVGIQPCGSAYSIDSYAGNSIDHVSGSFLMNPDDNGYTLKWFLIQTVDLWNNYSQSYTLNGTPVGGIVEEPLSGFNIGLAPFPMIEGDNGTGLLIQALDNGSGSEIFGTIVDYSTAEPISSRFTINSTTIGNQGNPKGILLDNGNYAVIWHSQETENGAATINGGIITPDGGTPPDISPFVSEEFTVITDAGNTDLGLAQSKLPLIVSNDEGGFTTIAKNTTGEVVAVNNNADGTSAGNQITIIANAENSYKENFVAIPLEKGYALFWNERGEVSGQYPDKLYGQIFTYDSIPAGKPFEIIQGDNSRGIVNLGIEAIDDNSFIVNWMQLYDNNSLLETQGEIFSYVYHTATSIEVTGASGYAIDMPSISAELTDKDGSESLSYSIIGAPVGTVLSDGNKSITVTGVNSAIDITELELNNLNIQPPAEVTESFTLTVRATATENANGDSATANQLINVIIDNNEIINTAPVAGDVDLVSVAEDNRPDS